MQNCLQGLLFVQKTKKYGYLNNLLLLGKGKKLRVPCKDTKGIVSYDLFKANYR